MTKNLNRRDFLKLAGLFPFGMASSQLAKTLGASGTLQGEKKNVLIIVYDALSAYNVPLYGYRRDTMPNLTRLARQAVVYHNHYAGCNFTTSGTASLLTGTLPWLHRALRGKDPVADSFVSRNIFSEFPDYYRISYSHNDWVNVFLEQFGKHLDEYVPPQSLFIKSYDSFIEALFGNDNDIASLSWTRNMNIREQGYAYSLFLSGLYGPLQDQREAKLRTIFPRGIPSTGSLDKKFILETSTDWVGNRLQKLQQPFLGYFHFMPPHGPYNTSLEFYNHFKNDGYIPLNKPEDRYFTRHTSRNELIERNTEYDEFLLYVDKEFGRLFNYLESSGLLENTWVILTSDHGELNERGIGGHNFDVMYEPVIRIPLLIFEPGRKSSLDIHTQTSAVDVLPTLSHVTGHKIPDWTEGILLPPYAPESQNPVRNIYSMRATKNDPKAALTQVCAAMIKDTFKLHYYIGFKERGVDKLVKLFNVKDDPEELVDIYNTKKSIADGMVNEFESKLSEMNKPYL
jgi:arylsulfatase A-like enzyme